MRRCFRALAQTVAFRAASAPCMKALSYAVAAMLAAAALTPILAEDYPLTEDSKPKEGVPKGEKLSFVLSDSKIFPGTTRNVTVYVPKQYDPAKPACVWINQDGMQHKADVVFDNLIAKGEMPVTVYIAASPGVVKSLNKDAALDRFNRSLEYDGLGDAFARFVLEELLPFVEKQKTSDGRPIVLSKKGNDRCIGGSSSGAVCAFTAAWERPQEFRRVFSTIGTYVGLRGADRYHTLIRKTEPQPLRVFLQDGDKDLNIYGGDWWMANQTMERALTWAGYEVEHAWGKEGHNGKHGDMLFPDAVRWIWKDWPKEPQTGKTGNPFLNDILLPGEGWQLVGEGYQDTTGPATAPNGDVYFIAKSDHTTYKISSGGKPESFRDNGHPVKNLTTGPDGRVFQLSKDDIFAFGGKGLAVPGYAKVEGSDAVCLPNGALYVTGAVGGTSELVPTRPSAVWYVSPEGKAQIVESSATTTKHPTDSERMDLRPQVPKVASGVAVSPDHSLLYVADGASHWVYSYQIQPDGSLKHKQRYFHLHAPDEDDNAGAGGMEVDKDGRLYVATSMGIQVCDQAGRVNCIIPTPNGKAADLAFGGTDFDTLYITCGDKVYRRKVKVKGVPAFASPVKPATPRL